MIEKTLKQTIESVKLDKKNYNRIIAFLHTLQEREYQDYKHPNSPLTSSQSSNYEKFTTLAEEVGEVAMAINDKDHEEYIRELIQVMACVLAILEQEDKLDSLIVREGFQI